MSPGSGFSWRPGPGHSSDRDDEPGLPPEQRAAEYRRAGLSDDHRPGVWRGRAFGDLDDTLRYCVAQDSGSRNAGSASGPAAGPGSPDFRVAARRFPAAAVALATAVGTPAVGATWRGHRLLSVVRQVVLNLFPFADGSPRRGRVSRWCERRLGSRRARCSGSLAQPRPELGGRSHPERYPHPGRRRRGRTGERPPDQRDPSPHHGILPELGCGFTPRIGPPERRGWPSWPRVLAASLWLRPRSPDDGWCSTAPITPSSGSCPGPWNGFPAPSGAGPPTCVLSPPDRPRPGTTGFTSPGFAPGTGWSRPERDGRLDPCPATLDPPSPATRLTPAGRCA